MSSSSSCFTGSAEPDCSLQTRYIWRITIISRDVLYGSVVGNQIDSVRCRIKYTEPNPERLGCGKHYHTVLISFYRKLH